MIFESNPIVVLASGNGWLAVDKPAGLSVHNDPGRDLCSSVTNLIQTNTRLYSRINADMDFGVNPVHRLDKETSGVILLAVTPAIFRYFSNQFETRKVQKSYIALLHGHIEHLPENPAWKEWDWPLAKTAGGRRDPQGTGPGQQSRTRYKAIGISTHYTMVEIELLTGRKHQIRRHAALAGHPVAGDSRYSSKRAITFLKENCGFDRIALHAASLSAQLPDQSQPICIKTIEIPAPIKNLFDHDGSTHR